MSAIDPERTDAVINLGRLALAFGRVDRITYHDDVPTSDDDDGPTLESDTDHTVMLGLIACALATEIGGLDVGLVAQYALVHDLVEVYAGDVPTLRALSADAKADKEQRERAALLRIADEFYFTLPWLPDTIADYEARVKPEARFVKALDKLMPKITHILNGCVTLREQGMAPDELRARYDLQVDELRAYAADFPGLFDLRADLVELVMGQYAAVVEGPPAGRDDATPTIGVDPKRLVAVLVESGWLVAGRGHAHVRLYPPGRGGGPTLYVPLDPTAPEYPSLMVATLADLRSRADFGAHASAALALLAGQS